MSNKAVSLSYQLYIHGTALLIAFKNCSFVFTVWLFGARSLALSLSRLSMRLPP